ncbi:MAG: NUDIX hydrolase [Patescibacteria group bacterium]
MQKKDTTFDSHKALIIPVNSQGEIFIQDRRGYKKPDWGYFGGGIKNGEVHLDAVIRETKEELDINIGESDLKYLGAFPVELDGARMNRHMYLFPTDQQKFNVLEGNGGYWLSIPEAKKRLTEHYDFEDIIARIQKVGHL